MTSENRTDPGTPDAPGGRLGALADQARGRQAGRGPAPVDKWNPEFCGDIDMRIAADGSWHYQGTPILREGLVRLFASVLRKDEDGRTYLVTPVEKVGIAVDDAPFLAVEMAREGEGREQTLALRTNMDEWVTAGPDHPLRFETAPDGGLKPYIRVRGRLDALVTRALVFDLADLAEEAREGGDDTLGIWSGGRFFPIGMAEDS